MHNVIENSSWSVINVDDGLIVNTYIQSSDMPHSARLKIEGDFASPEEQVYYAKLLIGRLHAINCFLNKSTKPRAYSGMGAVQQAYGKGVLRVGDYVYASSKWNTITKIDLVFSAENNNLSLCLELTPLPVSFLLASRLSLMGFLNDLFNKKNKGVLMSLLTHEEQAMLDMMLENLNQRVNDHLADEDESEEVTKALQAEYSLLKKLSGLLDGRTDQVGYISHKDGLALDVGKANPTTLEVFAAPAPEKGVRFPIYMYSAIRANKAEYDTYLKSTNALVRRLDLLLNGAGAAKQASLCDLVKQVETENIQSTKHIPF